MKIWLTKNSEVSIREQLLEQIMLGIASGDLARGERLPSTRELARRFEIHPNTVSAVYRELAQRGLAEFRKGSGVYVNGHAADQAGGRAVESLIARFVAEAGLLGLNANQLHRLLGERLNVSAATVMVVESDAALREILVSELQEAGPLRVIGVSLDEFRRSGAEDDAVITAMFDEREKLSHIIGKNRRCVFLTANSVPASLAGRRRPQADELVAVVSGWDTFLSLARLYLVAAKIDPGCIITRSTRELGWERGLSQSSIVICDAATARRMRDDLKPVVFRLISTDSLAEIRRAAELRL